MSVTGEFKRYVSALADLLDSTSTPWSASASQELQNATRTEDALARQAERILEIVQPLPALIGQAELDPHRERKMREGCEDVESIGRIILGR
jgi:hypothetical protein